MHIPQFFCYESESICHKTHKTTFNGNYLTCKDRSDDKCNKLILGQLTKIHINKIEITMKQYTHNNTKQDTSS